MLRVDIGFSHCLTVDKAFVAFNKPIDFVYHSVVHFSGVFYFFRQRGSAHEPSRVFLMSPETPKDAERNGRAFGNVA